MSLTTLTVDGNDYQSYSSIDEADIYIRPEPTLYGGWNGLSDTEKSIRLISATRRIDLLPWQGHKTDLHTRDAMAAQRSPVCGRDRRARRRDPGGH